MQVSILNGIYAKGNDFRVSYPVNMVPTPGLNGISGGYLRPAAGISTFATGAGVDRGGWNWDGLCYRASGSKLITVSEDGTTAILGDIGTGDGLARFDNSFDRLAIAAGGDLYYWDDSGLEKVTDPDLGTVVDMLWIDGYFMTTDGEFLVVTELNDPTSVNPLKYGSSEVDPDPVKALLKVRNEVHALNRYTIEVFRNIGGDLFPFQRVNGAQISRGVVGTRACCVYADSIVFVGSGKNEPVGVHIGASGNSNKISNREIDILLSAYTEAQLATVLVESRIEKGHGSVYVHLPDRTLVYDFRASEMANEPIWYILTSANAGFSAYRGKNAVYAYGEWIVGDHLSNNIGLLDDNIASHYGDKVRWEFSTTILYNDGNGAIIHQIELVALTGSIAFGLNPVISTAYSLDGETWSQDRTIAAGIAGQRSKRLVWFQQGRMRDRRMQRFRGNSDSKISVARLNIMPEALGV